MRSLNSIMRQETRDCAGKGNTVIIYWSEWVEYVNIRERRGQGNQGRNCFEENYKVSINNEKNEEEWN